MIKYSELVKLTMPAEKKAKASRCIVGHYLVRPISNIVSIPLIERKIDPTKVTIFSAIFPVIAYIAFCYIQSDLGFWIGWFSLLIWNILDGVDGNIARYNNQCTKMGELWDATVGWLAIIVFYIGMGHIAYRKPGIFFENAEIPNIAYIIIGNLSAWCWIFPRLIMQKKNVLMGEKAVSVVKDRANYGITKLIFFNITSINGLGAIFFMLAYLSNANGICTIMYLLISLCVGFGSMYSLLKRKGNQL